MRPITHANLTDFRDMIKLKEQWLNFLQKTPWADLSEIKTTFYEENAILVPMYVVHYDARSDANDFWIETWTTRNDDPKEFRPSKDSMEEALKLIKIEYEELLEMAKGINKNSKADFHEKFWKGHREDSKDQPALPELFKHLLDGKVEDLYSNTNQARVTPQIQRNKSMTTQTIGPWTDWAIMLSLRIDKLFTNQDIVVSMHIACHDNGAVGEGFWPIQEYEMMTWPSGQIGEMGRRFDFLVNGLQCASTIKSEHGLLSSRKHAEYNITKEDERAENWLTENHALLSNDGVSWGSIN